MTICLHLVLNEFVFHTNNNLPEGSVGTCHFHRNSPSLSNNHSHHTQPAKQINFILDVLCLKNK